MSHFHFVVDTNVAIVANGSSEDGQPVKATCRKAAVAFLRELLSKHIVLVDIQKHITSEYRNKLNPAGQPGVGDLFYQKVLQSGPDRVGWIDLDPSLHEEGGVFPVSLVTEGFDPSDRKFAALAKLCKVPVINATDSDWVIHAQTLAKEDIQVQNLCGIDLPLGR
jgi:hypothetical protein